MPKTNHQMKDILGTAYRRGLLNDLLVPALYTAVPLKQIHIVAMVIPKHLNFHVSAWQQGNMLKA